jgi:hypothetical protein
MDHEHIALQVTELLASEPTGTKITVWTDGAVTRTASSFNPIVTAGADSYPAAFFVAGFDRPLVDDVAERVRRAVRGVLRPAS